jgi:hypothetical protein
MNVPTEADWGNYEDDLDQKQAHDLFGGRTNHEMLPHFQRNVIERTDELRFMPEVPFRYYMLGFRDFLIGGEVEPLWVPDAASCFIGLVLEKLKKRPTHILPIMFELVPTLRLIAQDQDLWHAKKEIYGDFKEKLAQIEALRSSLGG